MRTAIASPARKVSGAKRRVWRPRRRIVLLVCVAMMVLRRPALSATTAQLGRLPSSGAYQASTKTKQAEPGARTAPLARIAEVTNGVVPRLQLSVLRVTGARLALLVPRLIPAQLELSVRTREMWRRRTAQIARRGHAARRLVLRRCQEAAPTVMFAERALSQLQVQRLAHQTSGARLES